MTLQQKALLDNVPFNNTKVAKRVSTKSNVRRIENENLKACYDSMGSWRIIGHTAKELAYRHRVGLLVTSVFGLLFYIAWDKVLNAFF